MFLAAEPSFHQEVRGPGSRPEDPRREPGTAYERARVRWSPGGVSEALE
jgi:hypothetical protein